MGNTTVKVVQPKRTKQGRCPKSMRFGCKQNHGTSRAAYFARRKGFLAAANKAWRIAKDVRRKEAAAAKGAGPRVISGDTE